MNYLFLDGDYDVDLLKIHTCNSPFRVKDFSTEKKCDQTIICFELDCELDASLIEIKTQTESINYVY